MCAKGSATPTQIVLDTPATCRRWNKKLMYVTLNWKLHIESHESARSCNELVGVRWPINLACKFDSSFWQLFAFVFHRSEFAINTVELATTREVEMCIVLFLSRVVSCGFFSARSCSYSVDRRVIPVSREIHIGALNSSTKLKKVKVNSCDATLCPFLGLSRQLPNWVIHLLLLHTPS